MKTFNLRISTPEGDAFNGDVIKISLRGTEGDLAVMAGHISFATAVKPCDCKIEFEDGTESLAHTDGGLLNVSSENVIYLCGEFNFLNN